MFQGFPQARPGQAVGLLGGSFDPAHEGHVRITRAALARFGLDRVWWLMSPGNPLKANGPAPLDRRLAQAREVMRHPRVTITDVEARLGSRYTAQTLVALQALYPGVRFVWLMGADNLAQLHLWQDWERIMTRVPVGVLARPGQRILGARLEGRAHLAAVTDPGGAVAAAGAVGAAGLVLRQPADVGGLVFGDPRRRALVGPPPAGVFPPR